MISLLFPSFVRPEVVPRLGFYILLEQGIVFFHYFARFHFRGVFAYGFVTHPVVTSSDGFEPEIYNAHAKFMGQAGSPCHRIGLLMQEIRDFVPGGFLVRELVGWEDIDQFVILVLQGVPEYACRVYVSFKAGAEKGCASVYGENFVPEGIAQFLVHDPHLVLSYYWCESFREVAKPASEQFPVPAMGGEHHHSIALFICPGQFRSEDGLTQVCLPELFVVGTAGEFESFREDITEMAVKLFFELFQFRVFLVRKGPGNVHRDYVLPVSEDVKGNPAENRGYGVVEAQRKLGKQAHQGHDKFYGILFHYPKLMNFYFNLTNCLFFPTFVSTLKPKNKNNYSYYVQEPS